MAEDVIKELPSSERAVSPQEFLQIANNLIPEVYEMHERENGPGSDHEQIFHRRKTHLEVVVQRVKHQIDLIKGVNPNLVTPIQEGRALLFADAHDLEQLRHIRDPQFKDTIREEIARELGNNEKNSAKRTIEFMREINQRFGKMIFIPEDEEVCNLTMDATIPKWNNDLGTVVQEQFTDKIPIEAKLVALADIGAAGCDPDHFIQDGNNEFKEVRIGITRAIIQAPKDKNGMPILSPDDEQYATEEMKKWQKVQLNWIKGREKSLEGELARFGDPRIAEALKTQYFNHFSESTSRIQGRIEGLQTKSFKQLLSLYEYLLL